MMHALRMDMLSGSRVKQARELRGWTQTELAERAGVSQSTIAYVENGRLSPSDDLVAALSLQTGFPLGFFKQEPSSEFPEGSLLLFRSKAAVTAREEAQAYRYAQTIFELSQKLTRIAVRLPHLPDESPTNAARITRSALGLSPDTPIPDLTRTVEKAGVCVLSLPITLPNIDAFSTWAGDSSPWPVVVTMADKPGDRLRLSVAHEIGHLVMHQAPRGSVGDLEREADAFAGELLLPAAAMQEELTTPVTLTSLGALKTRWRVSMQAIAMRAHDLGIITERQKRYLFQQFGTRKWRLREPIEVPLERARALRQMAELLYGDSLDYAKVAGDARLPETLVRQTLEGYVSKGGFRSVVVAEQPPTGTMLTFRKAQSCG
jgi:Zn-dependent peptidase ImmA (M78 family)/DNA-binding XRE family transcriptional regulator